MLKGKDPLLFFGEHCIAALHVKKLKRNRSRANMA